MPEALFEGEMDICGACVCIRDRERDTEYTPLWPAGYRLVPGQREFVIQDEAGNQIAETKAKRAEKLVLGGGETPSVDSAPASFLAQVKTCPPPYWFVSGPAQPFTGED